MKIVIDSETHKTLLKATALHDFPEGYFGFDEEVDPYKIVERFDKALKIFGLKIERVVKEGKGCYDPPYYFRIVSE